MGLTGDGEGQYSETQCHSRQSGRLAQLVRAPALQAGGRRFEPCTAHHFPCKSHTSANHDSVARGQVYARFTGGTFHNHYSLPTSDMAGDRRTRRGSGPAQPAKTRAFGARAAPTAQLNVVDVAACLPYDATNFTNA